MKASVFLFTILSLFTSTAHAGTITIDWGDEIVCDDSLEEGEICSGKIKTLMGEDLKFEGSASTLLFDDEETWGNCTLANATDIGSTFDSTPEGEKKVKGGRYFANDDSCSKRYKVIFKPKKFDKPEKKTSCSGTVIDTELGSDGKKCMKICKFELSNCGGYELVNNRGQKSCTFYEIGAELGVETARTKCRLAKAGPLKNIVLGE
ncbi:predicted protein [Chaetoceros tenuissimus]|uniref:Apple domain-containing protein n=1 Tax=Chaetoceros tenuissimus TaxID=426638 RepID=A0AAD3CUX8_9STRA|nr:predicted protein [Chaetoceros tenuissimus]